MVYKKHLIQARIDTWDSYELNDDYTLGDYVSSGGGDMDYPTYEVWALDDDGNADECVADDFGTIVEAKRFIDNQEIQELEG